MIYASLKSIDAWHTPLTPICFLLFALSGGLILASLAAAVGGGDVLQLSAAAAGATILAWFAKTLWRRRMLSMQSASTPETATGLGKIGRVKLFERPHMTENYLTSEMGFKIARKHAAKLARISFALGAALALLFLMMAIASSSVAPWLTIVSLVLAAICHYSGVFIERWLFFAEARHAVMNYYGG
jgi:sulfite dehydrogenase (quinone) subunit SoeC